LAENIQITDDFAGQRIDNFLVRYLKNLPKTRIYRMLRKGEVRVNKGRVKPSYHLQSGDNIRLPPANTYQRDEGKENKKITCASRSLTQLTQKIARDAILYEDEQLMVINKPSGLAVHGGSGLSHGLIELLRLHYPKYLQLDLVHRLDRDTSGCILVAKKHSMLRLMHGLLRESKVCKQYHALVKGGMEKAQDVKVPLRKYHLSSGERIVRVQDDGQAAITKFEPIAAYSNAMLLKAIPITGRTHQIRVHAQYIGCPIAGDEKYGDKDFNKDMKQYGLNRLFLHAHTLEFEHPKTKRFISVTAEYDNCLKQTLKNLT
jgi:23S rRNA pseudouridine955/2504/2580 synthase